MRNRVPILLTGIICLAAGYLLNSPWVSAQGGITSISAIPNQKGGQDVFGGYEVVAPRRPRTSGCGRRPCTPSPAPAVCLTKRP